MHFQYFNLSSYYLTQEICCIVHLTQEKKMWLALCDEKGIKVINKQDIFWDRKDRNEGKHAKRLKEINGEKDLRNA